MILGLLRAGAYLGTAMATFATILAALYFFTFSSFGGLSSLNFGQPAACEGPTLGLRLQELGELLLLFGLPVLLSTLIALRLRQPNRRVLAALPVAVLLVTLALNLAASLSRDAQLARWCDAVEAGEVEIDAEEGVKTIVTARPEPTVRVSLLRGLTGWSAYAVFFAIGVVAMRLALPVRPENEDA